MNETAGKIIHIAQDNPAVPGCTISKQVCQARDVDLYYFSMAAHTNISAEQYSYSKLITVYNGVLEVFDENGQAQALGAGDSILTVAGGFVGVKTEDGCVYTEMNFRKESQMNELLKAGEVFKLAELIPYQEDKIVNMDLVHTDKMKYALMSFDAGTGLSEHAAPGEALVFALDGEGIIGYEGVDYTIKAGETFKFDKLGKHSIKAVTPFKMALFLVLE